MDGLVIMIMVPFGIYNKLMYQINFFFKKSVPRIPWKKEKPKPSTFYGPDDPVPIFLAIVMGVQRNLKEPTHTHTHT